MRVLTPIERLILSLAASGLSRNELQVALTEFQRLNKGDVVAVVDRIREAAAQSFFNESAAWDSSDAEQARKLNSERAATDQIDRLLRVEAGLSSSEAAELLLRELPANTWFGMPPVKPRKKEGLRQWLNRLIRVVPASTLLHHATRIRNDRVHDSQSDWPLRDTKER